jgi:sugar-specific transcriptional regulator TrmB
MLEKELKEFGLSEKEIKVYLACLELGRAPVQEISKKSGVNRATTYVQLDNLIDRGLVSTVDKDKKNTIIAEKPSRIVRILEKRQNKLASLEDKFKTLMPDLEAIYNVKSDKPQVKFFEKEVGLEMVRSDFIGSKLDIAYGIMPTHDHEEEDEEVINKLLSSVKKVKLIKIGPKNVKSKMDKFSHSEVRFLKMDKFELDFMIYNHKVFINKPVARDENMGILIEDKIVTESFVAMFDLFWQQSEPLLPLD